MPLLQVLEELYLRGRLESAARVASSIRRDSWMLRIASPYLKTLLALIRTPQISDRDPLEDFVASVQTLATADGPRANLLPVAERCIGLVPEVWESVPAAILESAAIEIVRVLCAAGEAERTIDIDQLWAENGVEFSSGFRAQLERVRSETLGTYDAFRRRLRMLREQVAILEDAHSLIVTRLGLLREMSFIYWYIGDFERCRIYSERTVVESEKSLGQFHPETFGAATDFVISLMNIGQDDAAARIADEWYRRMLKQNAPLQTLWQLRLRRYAVVEVSIEVPISRTTKIQRREIVLSEMLIHLGSSSREYIRCLNAQGLDLIEDESPRGYSLVEDALRFAFTNLGEMDHDTLSMMVPRWLGLLSANPSENAAGYASFYGKLVRELGPEHPLASRLRDSAVRAGVWREPPVA